MLERKLGNQPAPITPPRERPEQEQAAALGEAGRAREETGEVDYPASRPNNKCYWENNFVQVGYL